MSQQQLRMSTRMYRHSLSVDDIRKRVGSGTDSYLNQFVREDHLQTVNVLSTSS